MSLNNNNVPSLNKGRVRSSKVFLVCALVFIIFWCVIIFYASRREKSLKIKITPDFELPSIDDKYLIEDGVPKIFHQLWKSSKIPSEWQESHRRCLELNPEYKLIIWTDEMIYNFIALKYPWIFSIFIRYPYHIQRVDVARYFILYHYGGVYLDVDAMCKTPFNDIIANMTYGQSVLVPMTDIYGVTNSFMVSKQHSDFFKYVIYELPSYANGPFTLVRHTTVIFSTGPMFISHCVASYKYPEDIAVLSIREYDEVHFFHAKGGSWHGMDTEIVDVFHFHYLKLLLVAGCFMAFCVILKYKKDFICCCMVKVTNMFLRGSNDRSVHKTFKTDEETL